jgi:hypothetical protein
MANKPTIKAWCGDLDGRIIALGGFARIKSRWFAFLDLTDDARLYKMTLMRTAKRMMADAEKMGLRFVYAEADPREPRATMWMESLGFVIDPRTNSLYRWKNTQCR